MIRVFNGHWRGLGQKDKQVGAVISFQFREYLHHFKGATLHVFLSICLHADAEGYCYPSYDTLQKETGYGRGTVGKIIAELCEMEIEGHKVLMRWRERDEKGQYTGSNRYRIFPTEEEIAAFDVQSSVSSTVDTQSSLFPTLDKSNCGQSVLEDKPIKKDKPSSKEPAHNDDVVPDAAAVFKLWTNNMPGTLSQIIADNLNDLIDTYSPPEVCYAITQAVKYNKRNLPYVQRILENRAAGIDKPAKNGNGDVDLYALLGAKRNA